jgi:hypothetical protein
MQQQHKDSNWGGMTEAVHLCHDIFKRLEWKSITKDGWSSSSNTTISKREKQRTLGSLSIAPVPEGEEWGRHLGPSSIAPRACTNNTNVDD